MGSGSGPGLAGLTGHVSEIQILSHWDELDEEQIPGHLFHLKQQDCRRSQGIDVLRDGKRELMFKKKLYALGKPCLTR